MKYFRWSLDEVMNMSWDNFMLFMASIPRYDFDERGTSAGTEKIEEKEAWEIF